MKSTKDQELFQKIIVKAWEDDTFKQGLISNPINAIEGLTGEKLSVKEGKKLKVFDQTEKDVVYLNIPVKPDIENLELTEEQLEAVAGGEDIVKTLVRVLTPSLADFFQI
ncbi:NHLP leader peptide family RiPP precursor [uncultured Tenacibaculum sp.]|uniref:NHLP leader peptide family RiPP precursor n=1 Tax=uncultured Tenacibaculum sp. TaxID=174713 RepID=UPI00262B17E7|nr:NHLP leader peptide family RiPP precursor [uncultured Tenacibaculum sp.]